MANKSRKPFGEWKPSTEQEDLEMTDFENDETLRREVEREVSELAQRIETSTTYKLAGSAQELDPQIVRGLLEAKDEERA